MIFHSVGPGTGALTAPDISRALCEAGMEVEVILDPGSRSFIGPVAFAGIAAVVEKPSETPGILLFAPASSGVVARLAHGLSSEISTAYADGVRPAFVAPDFDAATANHPAVRRNLAFLRDDGVRVIEGAGKGMASAQAVVAAVLGGLGGPLAGKRVLVTAGGTREPIDSVRFVGNRSSGKMGLAVAREAFHLGADVSVVAANVEREEPGVGWFPVETVEEMKEAVMDLAAEADVLIMAAAISDFTPAQRVSEKVRRRDGLRVEFTPTADILAEVRQEYPGLFMIGFSATHGDAVADAREKLVSKGVDIVVGNDISQAGIGFSSDENEAWVVSRDEERFVPRASKKDVARAILDTMISDMSE
ncbi:MAG: bifunctional phosphopantothenoylcysteine decarboxylase/phosphopantothenate--cysteine ligase CoaBC [Rubrobacteraceae bacterium]